MAWKGVEKASNHREIGRFFVEAANRCGLRILDTRTPEGGYDRHCFGTLYVSAAMLGGIRPSGRTPSRRLRCGGYFRLGFHLRRVPMKGALWAKRIAVDDRFGWSCLKSESSSRPTRS
jgi:hypothetical protein